MTVRCAFLLLCLLLAVPAAAVADVGLSATGPQFAVVDTEATYVVTVVNRGPGASGDIDLTDAIPADARLVRTSGADCTPGTPLRCTVDSLAVGKSATVTIVLAGTRVGATLHHVINGAGGISASVDTVITAPSVAPPPPPLPSPPCANVIRGGRDDDALTGTAFGDTIYGFERSDLLRGADGADCLWGGEGNDVLDGDGGDDQLWGGNGKDRLVGGAGNDRLSGGLKRDVLLGGDGDDQLLPGTGKDLVRAGFGNDTISARDGARDVIECGPGDDTVRADRGDRLRGCEHVARR